jgi:fucose 4-O-acetylase-like acetyltransferase
VLSEENIQRYVRSLYSVAVLLVVVPFADLSLRAFPPQFGSLQWRFGTTGLLLGNLGTILLGIGLFGLVAALSGHRRVLRGLGYAAIVIAVIALAILAMFVLDAVQMRQLANPNFKRAILLSSTGALIAGLIGTLTCIAIGRGAIAASRPSSGGAYRPRASNAPLVVAAPGARDGT